MQPRHALVLMRVASLVALLVSATLLVDYLRPVPAFCGAGSGCEQIKLTHGFVAGVPIPAIGLLGFFVLIMLSAVPTRVSRMLAAVGAVLGGVLGFGFIASQIFWIGSICKYCVVVDTAAIFAAICGVYVIKGLRSSPSLGADIVGLPAASWITFSVAAVLAPSVWLYAQPPTGAPVDIRAFWKSDAQINVVDFSDFECPFCRKAHPRIEEALKDVQGVNFVRKSIPLDFHPHARFATKVYLCAAQQGKGEAVAHELFETEDLSAKNCEVLAFKQGVVRDQFKTCLDSQEIEQQIERDRELFKNAGMRGLPSIWINNELLGGLRETKDYSDAITRARASGDSPSLRLGPVLMWLASVVAAFVWGRKKSALFLI